MTTLTESQAATIARQLAAENDLALDADALEAVVARLTADLGLDDHRALAFEIATPFRVERGAVIDAVPLDHALEIVRAHGKPTARPARTQAAQAAPRAADALPISTPQWARESKGPIAEFAIGQAADHDAKMAAQTETYRNPWLPGQINRTHQSHVNKYNPGLAARFKTQAGV